LGLIIGAAFSNVVTSLVSDIILPPITLVSPNAKNLANHFFVLRHGETPDEVYNTREQAAADGESSTYMQSLTDRGCLYGLGFIFAKGTQLEQLTVQMS
jgi:large-conductance mechanosensitive channel